jgi:hypothetical protein
VASFLVEELRRGTRRHRWAERPIEVRAVGHSHSRPAALHGLQESRVGKVHARARLAQLGDDLATVRHEDLFPVPDETEVLTEPVLEFTHAHDLHEAECRYVRLHCQARAPRAEQPLHETTFRRSLQRLTQ